MHPLALLALLSPLVINEILYDTTGTEPQGEWIELYNNTDTDIDRFLDRVRAYLPRPVSSSNHRKEKGT